MKSAVTISLVEEARGGPFMFWHDLEEACRVAAKFGFDGIEVFPADAASFPAAELKRLLVQYDLELAAVGTGAGWVRKKLHLAAATADERRQALEFIKGIIEVAGDFGAPAIVGSMQGKPTPGVSREDQRKW
ncbi:MAG TPA: TIM barrel protein, partial [Planctomycetia bacterium]|nr:TIM barrel protein [Planctomycetia bacterium]